MRRRLLGGLLASFILVLVGAMPVSAAGRFTLFGDAIRVHPGFNSHTAIQLRSVGAGFGGIDFKVQPGLTFGQVQNLGANFRFTAGSCGGGAPRFQVNVDGKNVFVYIGPPPNYTGCAMNLWQDTGDLVAPASFVDTSQLPGGTFYDTFASADLKYGSHVVTGIQLVTDAGWKFGTQTVVVDNVRINGATFTFEGRGQGDRGDNNDENGDEGGLD